MSYFIKEDRSIEAFGFGVNPAEDLFMTDGYSKNGFFSYKPLPGVKLYRLALIDQPSGPRSTIFATKVGKGGLRFWMRYDGSHTSGTNVIKELSRKKLPQELSDIISLLETDKLETDELR